MVQPKRPGLSGKSGPGEFGFPSGARSAAELTGGPRSLAVLHLGADFLDLRRRHGRSIIRPALADVGEDVGDLLVVEIHMGRHHGVVVFPRNLDRSLEAADDDADRQGRVAGQPVGVVERRERVLKTRPGRLVAGDAGQAVNRQAALMDGRVGFELLLLRRGDRRGVGACCERARVG